MLSLAQVSHRYGATPALADVSLAVGRGDFVCLLGPNGAGKSTLLRVASGFLTPDAGQVQWEGRSLRHLPRLEMARHVAFVPQKTVIDFPFSVREVTMMGRAPRQNLLGAASARDREVVEAVLDWLDLRALADRPVTELSGGEAQRAVLAAAVAQETELLVLDEPTSHLDPRHALRLLETLRRLNRERGVGILLSMHDVNLAALFAQRLVLLCGGRLLFDGPPAEALTVDRLAEAFDVQVAVQGHPTRAVPQVFLQPSEP